MITVHLSQLSAFVLHDERWLPTKKCVVKKSEDTVDPYDMHTEHASTPMETYLQAFGQGVVHYKTHIWLVNAHPKRNGCTYHLQATTLPLPLHLDALFRGHASMVMVCLKLTTLLQCITCVLTT